MLARALRLANTKQFQRLGRAIEWLHCSQGEMLCWYVCLNCKGNFKKQSDDRIQPIFLKAKLSVVMVRLMKQSWTKVLTVFSVGYGEDS